MPPLPSIPPNVRELIEAKVRSNPRRLIAVIDYLPVTTDDHEGRTPAGFDGTVHLPAGIRIERLDSALAERLLYATDLRGENWEPRARSYHVVHAYVREAWREADDELPRDLYHWDTEGSVYECVQLSRLVRDNATSTEFAVRRLIHADASETLVPFDGFDSHVAYRLRPDQPGWLDVDEAQQLGVLMRAYREGPTLPDRAREGLRRVEVVTRQRYLQDALPLVVGGLEALLKVGRRSATAQFSQRVPEVARGEGVTLTEAQCRELYDDRSALVHGTTVDLSQPHKRDSFEQGFVDLQETLRRAVRRAVQDPAFAAIFADEARLVARWPARHRGASV